MESFLPDKFPGKSKGQSMVEMAIIAPLLIFFLLGIFEVGWALRNYLVLVNVNREITRFAIRPGYMNFSTEADIEASYDRIKEWARSSVSEQLPLDFDSSEASTTLIISHLVVDTGQPCDGDCTVDCSAFDTPGYNPFPQDDLIIHPGLAGYDYQTTRFGPTQTVTGPRDTRIDFDQITGQLVDQNNKFNCQILKKGGVASANNVIITEIYHDQPQLFGFPLISNPFTDPVPLYSHTTMRLINAARSSGGVEGSLIANIDSIGPICLAYPFLVKSSDVGPTSKNIIEHGWLKWGDAFADPELYLQNALQFPQMSLNDFSEPGGIQSGSDVTLVSLSNPDLGTQLEALRNRPIIIPTTGQSTPGNPVKIDGFVWVTISDFDLTNSPNSVTASFDLTTSLPTSCS